MRNLRRGPELPQSGSCAQPYLKGRVGRHAQRTPQRGSQLQCAQPYALRWRVSSAPVLRPSRPAESLDDRCALPTTQYALQRRRDVAGAALSDAPRARAVGKHTPADPQWRLPAAHGVAHLSECHDVAPVSPPAGPGGLAQAAPAARSVPWPGARGRRAAPLRVRCRLHRGRGLRPAGAGPARLQSHQAGPPLVPSPGLLRGHQPRLLGRGTAARRCPHGAGGRRPARGLLRAVARGRAAGGRPGGQGVLRRENRRRPGGPPVGLRHRRPPHPADQTPTGGAALYPAPRPGGDGGVLVPTPSLAGALSVRGHPAPPGGGPERPAHAVYGQAVHPSSPRHKPGSGADPPLAVLQRSGGARTDHPRTERGLSARTGADETFLRERGLLPSPTLRLQPGAVVQALLPARGVADPDSRHPAVTAFPHARAVRPIREPADLAPPCDVSARGRVEACAQADQPTEALRAIFTPDSGLSLTPTPPRRAATS